MWESQSDTSWPKGAEHCSVTDLTEVSDEESDSEETAKQAMQARRDEAFGKAKRSLKTNKTMSSGLSASGGVTKNCPSTKR